MNILEKTIRYLSCLFLFLLPWQTIFIFQERFVNGAKWEYGTLGMYGTEILGWTLVLLFMVWYVFRLKNSEFRIQNFSWSRERVFVLSLLLFTLYSLFLSFFAPDSSIAFQHSQRIVLGSLLFLLFYIGPIKPQVALWAFVLGSVPVSVLGIWQFLSQSTVASTWLGLSQYIVQDAGTSIIASEHIGRWLRAYGSFSHPNVFGGYLVIALMSTLVLYKRSRGWGSVVLHAIIVLQTSALFFTFSRSAWIALVVGVLVYLFIGFHGKWISSPFLRGRLGGGCSDYRRPLPCLTSFRLIHLLGRRKGGVFSVQPHPNPPLRKGREYLFPCITIVVSFVVLSTIFSPLVHTRLGGTSVNEVASITERVDGYGQAKQLFQDNVWFGVGPGQYTRALIEAFPDKPGWWYQPVHNVGALFVVELGGIGVVLGLFSVWAFVRNWKLEIHLADGQVGNVGVYSVSVLPLLLMDHYAWSSWVGLALVASMAGIYMKIQKNEVETSLDHEEEGCRGTGWRSPSYLADTTEYY